MLCPETTVKMTFHQWLRSDDCSQLGLRQRVSVGVQEKRLHTLNSGVLLFPLISLSRLSPALFTQRSPQRCSTDISDVPQAKGTVLTFRRNRSVTSDTPLHFSHNKTGYICKASVFNCRLLSRKWKALLASSWRDSFSHFWLTGVFVSSDGDSMEDEAEFNWEEYMEETGANAAPHTTFKHVSALALIPSPLWSFKYSLPDKYHMQEHFNDILQGAKPRHQQNVSLALLPSDAAVAKQPSPVSENTTVSDHWSANDNNKHPAGS